jgi:hypothetical protein
MRISRQPTPLQIKIDKKQVENVEEFNYLGSMIIDHKLCKVYTGNQGQDCHGKSSINQEEDSLHQQIRHRAKEETSEVLHLEHSFVWCGNLDFSEIRSDVSRKFSNVVLEKDGEDKLNRPRK